MRFASTTNLASQIRNPSIVRHFLSRSLTRTCSSERCRTLGDPALQISETPTLSSSSTSLSVFPPFVLVKFSIFPSPFLSQSLMLAFVLLLGTTADDLFPLFDKYGKVVDVFIPRDRRFLSVFLSHSHTHTCSFCFQFGVFWLIIGLENREDSLLFGISMRMRHRKRWKSLMVSFTLLNSISTSL